MTDKTLRSNEIHFDAAAGTLRRGPPSIAVQTRRGMGNTLGFAPTERSPGTERIPRPLGGPGGPPSSLPWWAVSPASTGTKRMPKSPKSKPSSRRGKRKFAKGSPEARAHMAALRARRGTTKKSSRKPKSVRKPASVRKAPSSRSAWILTPAAALPGRRKPKSVRKPASVRKAPSSRSAYIAALRAKYEAPEPPPWGGLPAHFAGSKKSSRKAKSVAKKRAARRIHTSAGGVWQGRDRTAKSQGSRDPHGRFGFRGAAVAAAPTGASKKRRKKVSKKAAASVRHVAKKRQKKAASVRHVASVRKPASVRAPSSATLSTKSFLKKIGL